MGWNHNLRLISDGNFRVKSETLVAGGGDGFIESDATDDTKFADS